MRAAGNWILVVLWVLSLTAPGFASSSAPSPSLMIQSTPETNALQGTALALSSPADCPPGGCAAGQRMNVRFNFKLESYDPNLASGGPNVKVCLYAPAAWGVNPAAVDVTATGDVTKKPYTRAAECAQDTDTSPAYTLIAAIESALDFREFADQLGFAFRLGPNASGRSQLIARVFQRRTDPAKWELTGDTITAPLQVIPTAQTVYVANDPASCGGLYPCYVNSGDDLANGLGTGLKDAVDVAPDLSPNLAIVYIVGNYTIKSNTVFIDRPMMVAGLNNASITYAQSGACQNAMLFLVNRVAVVNLNINDGTCTNPDRDLISINTPSLAQLTSNTLTGGGNAVYVFDTGGSVSLQFNHISGNSGFAVFFDGGAKAGAMNMVANNLNGNRPGPAVECGAGSPSVLANRVANHNYWGGNPPSQADTRCAITPGKELGAPIARTTGVPGVNAALVNVTDIEADAFGGQVSYSRTGGSNFPLYIVDHGYAQTGSNPFVWKNIRSPSPCSNFYDIFLASPAGTDSTLNLSFKYNRSTSCETVINSIQYCDQTTNPGKYPLFWYDPQNGITTGWEPVGATPTGPNSTGSIGQTTSCSIAEKEIRVAIDTSGRPNLTSDLNFTPLMVGIPVLKRFLPLASNQTITVTWETNNEPDLKGFYVLRSSDGVNYTNISELIPPKGNGLTGAFYNNVVDANRVNNQTYYYQLQIVRNDGFSFFSEVFSIVPNVATITPTPTITPSRTATLTWTNAPPLPTWTPVTPRVSTQVPTRVMTRTPTPQSLGVTRTPPELPTGTFFPFRSGTPDPTDYFIPGRTQTTPGTLPAGSEDGTTTPGNDGTATVTPEGTVTPGTGTPIAMLGTRTVSPTAAGTGTVVSPTAENSPPTWLSLIIGLLSGLACVVAAGWWWYHNSQR